MISKQTPSGKPLQIKFSHQYRKFVKDELYGTVVLLDVRVVDLKDLSKAFLDYDTFYWTRKGNEGHYPLKEGLYLLLFFRSEYYIGFTTLRSWNEKKEKYNRENIGSEFKVVITDD
jgi:hypothetical protein